MNQKELLKLKEGLEPFLFPVKDLIFSEANPRTITANKLNQLKKSITDFTKMLWLRPLVIDETNTVLGGNQRGTAALQLEMDLIPVIKVTGLTPEQKKEFIIKDNAGFGEWDWSKLKSEEWDQGKLSEWGLDMPEEKNENSITEPSDECLPTVTNIVHGDLIEIGKHRIVCGDSKDRNNFEKLFQEKKAALIFTDPPYGVKAVGKRTQNVKSTDIKIKNDELKNDELKNDELKSFLTQCFVNVNEYLVTDASLYVCCDHKTIFEFTSSLVYDLRFLYKNTIIWNKNKLGLSGGKGYRAKYEMILFLNTSKNYFWSGGMDQANVWDNPGANIIEKEGGHLTPKPISIPSKAIINSSKANDIVLDLFLGGGSTLYSCEQLNRICYGIEYEPIHCENIIIKAKKMFPHLSVRINGIDYGTK